MRRAGWFLIAALVATALGASAVFAHADYDRSEPARSEVLPQAPERVDVWFTQDLVKRAGANNISVFDETGAEVTAEEVTVDDDDRTHAFVTLPPDLPPGRYVVEWMSTSDVDGDSHEGAFAFYAGVEPTAEQLADDAELASGDEEEPSPTAAPTAVATPAPTAPASGGDGDGTSGAVLALIGIGGAAIGLLGGAGLFLFWRRRAEGEA